MFVDFVGAKHTLRELLRRTGDKFCNQPKVLYPNANASGTLRERPPLTQPMQPDMILIRQSLVADIANG